MAGLTHDKYSITFAAVTITFVCNLMARPRTLPSPRPLSLSAALCDVAQVAIALDSAHGRSGTGRVATRSSTSFVTVSLPTNLGRMGRFIKDTKMILRKTT